MTDLSKLVADVITLNGGSLVGKTRLQKTLYLLEQRGMGSGIDFDYHYYGPYSEGLTQATRWAELEGLLTEEEDVASSGDLYSTFRARTEPDESVGQLNKEEVSSYLRVLKNYNGIELELAATIHYLQNHGYDESAINETRARKPSKASDGRIKRACDLLRALGLEVPYSPA